MFNNLFILFIFFSQSSLFNSQSDEQGKSLTTRGWGIFFGTELSFLRLSKALTSFNFPNSSTGLWKPIGVSLFIYSLAVFIRRVRFVLVSRSRRTEQVCPATVILCLRRVSCQWRWSKGGEDVFSGEGVQSEKVS